MRIAHRWALMVTSVVLAGSTALAAERDRNREITLGYGKSKPPVVQANPCAAHGPGFQAVPGTTSCVKMIGGVRFDTATAHRKLR
ncbi:MAG: porin [Proteobacteria bacterium]|nr:porin [Pseudomonadota bacterium]